MDSIHSARSVYHVNRPAAFRRKQTASGFGPVPTCSLSLFKWPSFLGFPSFTLFDFSCSLSESKCIPRSNRTGQSAQVIWLVQLLSWISPKFLIHFPKILRTFRCDPLRTPDSEVRNPNISKLTGVGWRRVFFCWIPNFGSSLIRMLFEWLLNFRYTVGCLIFSTGGFVRRSASGPASGPASGLASGSTSRSGNFSQSYVNWTLRRFYRVDCEKAYLLV